MYHEAQAQAPYSGYVWGPNRKLSFEPPRRKMEHCSTCSFTGGNHAGCYCPVAKQPSANKVRAIKIVVVIICITLASQQMVINGLLTIRRVTL